MDSEFSGRQLRLPDLSISGFRGIEHLSIGRLGRVTLLAGRNGIGKTTVLEAVRVYAARSDPTTLDTVLGRADEFFPVDDGDMDSVDVPDYAALFHGRRALPDETISIGSQSPNQTLTLVLCIASDLTDSERKPVYELTRDPDALVLRITLGGVATVVPLPVGEDRHLSPRARHMRAGGRWGWRHPEDLPAPIKCESVGPGPPGNDAMLDFWEKVALQAGEDRAMEALRLVHGVDVERVAFVGGGRGPYRGKRAIVKMRARANPVPLRSLGDGAVRMFAVALALANCRDGFLVIDEAENGIHHQVQDDYWRMILQTAARNNVQVLATTHSWDCVRGFSRAATALDDVEGCLVRLERRGEEIRAVEYDEELLKTVADQRIEVR